MRSKTIFLGIALVPALLGFASTVRLQRSDPAAWTLGQWRRWRDQEIGQILQPASPASAEPILARHGVIQRCGEAYSLLRPLLKNPGFLADSGRRAELGNFIKFVSAEQRLELKDRDGFLTHGLAMELSDADYWRFVSPYVGFPDLLKSQEFLELLSKPKSYGEASDMIRDNNQSLPDDRKWVVYPFKSQFILSVDETTYGRLLVLVPNEPIQGGRLLDRWVQFAIATPDQDPAPKIMSVSVIGIVHGGAGSEPNKAYLSDFMRVTDEGNGEVQIKPNFLMKPNPSKVCFDCHKTAVIPIHPGTAYIFNDRGKLESSNERDPVPDQLNRLIEGYGKCEFGSLDPDSYGPSLGVTTPVSDAFISEATRESPVSLQSYDAIRQEMNCSKCHDKFAKINYLAAVRTDRDAKAFQSRKGLVQTFIENGWMPPQNHLSPEERHALWQCVMNAYLDPKTGTGSFVDWLRGANP